MALSEIDIGAINGSFAKENREALSGMRRAIEKMAKDEAEVS